jgi:transposase
MPRPCGSTVALSDATRDQLEALVRARSTPQALALRCRIVLRAAEGDRPSNQDIADALGCNRHTVGQWRERFVAHGLGGLHDLPRSGRPRSFSPL